MTKQSEPEQASTGGAPSTDPRTGVLSTALSCMVTVARNHGVDWSTDRLIHDYAIDRPDEISTDLMLRIARDNGFRAKIGSLEWQDLPDLGRAFPVIAELSNGNWVIVAGFKPPDVDAPEGQAMAAPEDMDMTRGQAVVLDPLSEQPGLIFLDREDFEPRWTGRVLFLKRAYKLTDVDQPFGLRWFVPEFLKQKRLFRDVGLAALALHILALAVPIFFQLVIDKVLLHQVATTLYVLTIGIAVAILFDSIFTYLRKFMLLYLSRRIDIRVATRTFAHLLNLPIDFFERGSAGVLVKHMQQGERIRQFLAGRLFLTLLDASALLVFVPVLFFYSPTLTALVLAFALIIAGVIFALIKPFQRRLREHYEAEGQRQAHLVETIHGMRTVKSLSLEPRQRRSWDQRAASAVNTHFEVGKISTVAEALTGGLEKLMVVAIIAIGAMLVFDGTLTVGALVAFNMISRRVSAPLVQLVSLIHEYQEAALSVRMLGQIMNTKGEEGTDLRGITLPLKGQMEFEHVTFRYTPVGAPALDDLSLTIEAGKVFGIVGRSGSGKTTLTRLIQRLYHVQDGIVRIDGHDVREIDLIHLRRNIGVVLQDNFMFRGTVRENIGAGKPDASFEQIVQAAKMAGAIEFIERLPQGFDTPLDEDAANLSGGQKQRLAIARALLIDPPILIFDEATSALDPESEHIIQQNLRSIAAGRTVIIVSHRLASLKGADQILVLENGAQAGLGTHEQLLEDCPIYRKLWQQQHGASK